MHKAVPSLCMPENVWAGGIVSREQKQCEESKLGLADFYSSKPNLFHQF